MGIRPRHPTTEEWERGVPLPEQMALEEIAARQSRYAEERAKMIDSTSDERIVNNVMRHEYRPLNDIEKRQMKDIKDAGLAFVAMLHNIGGTLTEFHQNGDDARQSSRALSLAQTKIEEAVMWAVKHVTR